MWKNTYSLNTSVWLKFSNLLSMSLTYNTPWAYNLLCLNVILEGRGILTYPKLSLKKWPNDNNEIQFFDGICDWTSDKVQEPVVQYR